MSRSPTRHIVGTIALALFVGACESPLPPIAPEPAAVRPFDSGILDVLAPPLERSLLTQTRVLEPERPVLASVPMLTESEDGPAEIFSERTVVGFQYGEAFAEGSHYYTGSVGRVETNLHVTFQNMHVASVPAVTQKSDWMSLSVRKRVWAYARAVVDQTCGLRASGNSTHRAWWSFFQIRTTNNYGEVVRSTSADPASQSACGISISNQDPSGNYDPPQGFSCTYLITYDRNTLEVLDVELMSCQTTGVLF